MTICGVLAFRRAAVFRIATRLRALFKESIFYRQPDSTLPENASYPGDIMLPKIRLFPCLTDNFGYLITTPRPRDRLDRCPEAAPSSRRWSAEGWTLTDILVTHTTAIMSAASPS